MKYFHIFPHSAVIAEKGQRFFSPERTRAEEASTQDSRTVGSDFRDPIKDKNHWTIRLVGI